ncbi:MAG: hypothetical protein VX999_04540 [Candidatus Thermoplasmatota archaeon]|nr:hypothetical protein [Candidatus Thermoplasmatota archaeon]
MQSQRLGLVLLIISIVLFVESIDRMDWWDQADKEYERECLPNYNPQPDAELCVELENEANSRMRVFSVVLFSSIVLSLIGLAYLLPSGTDYPRPPPGGRF